MNAIPRHKNLLPGLLILTMTLAAHQAGAVLFTDDFTTNPFPAEDSEWYRRAPNDGSNTDTRIFWNEGEALVEANGGATPNTTFNFTRMESAGSVSIGETAIAHITLTGEYNFSTFGLALNNTPQSPTAINGQTSSRYVYINLRNNSGQGGVTQTQVSYRDGTGAATDVTETGLNMSNGDKFIFSLTQTNASTFAYSIERVGDSVWTSGTITLGGVGSETLYYGVYSSGTTNFDVTMAQVIPEPGVASLLLGAMVCLGIRRRFSRHRPSILRS